MKLSRTLLVLAGLGLAGIASAAVDQSTWGDVQRIDRAGDATRITLRTSSGPRTLLLDPSATISDHTGKQVPLEQLKRGDWVRADYAAENPGASDEVDRATRLQNLEPLKTAPAQP